MAYRDAVHPLRMYGRGRYATVGILPYTKPRVVMNGTAIAGGVTEAEIVTGSQTVILTLSNGKLIPAGALFDAQRQAIIDGMDSAQSEAGGWDAKIKAVAAVTTVVRTSDTVITFTTPAAALYAITADEVITVTIPAAVMAGQFEPLAAGTFTITAA